MNGEFILEDHLGEVIFASSPGIETSSRVTSVKKAKPAPKRINKKPLIEFFDTLSNVEADPSWVKRFQKMSIYRFPSKISWTPLTNAEFYGDLVYKSRQVTEILKISKIKPIEDVIDEIKAFIKNYTNIKEEDKEEEYDVKIISKTDITPIPWAKLSSKDHNFFLTEYIKTFALENSLNKEEASCLLKSIIIFYMGYTKFPHLVFDKDGKIINITNIYKENNVYKLKFP